MMGQRYLFFLAMQFLVCGKNVTAKVNPLRKTSPLLAFLKHASNSRNGKGRSPRAILSRAAMTRQTQCDDNKKIVVTGLGVVNGIGVGVDEFWKNVLAGKSGIKKIESFDVNDMVCQLACEVTNDQFDPRDYYKDPKDVKRNDRYSHFSMGASKMAMEDAGIDHTKLDPTRFGVVVGSGIGGISWMENEGKTLLSRGHRKVSPFLIPAMIANTAPALIAIEFNAKGPNHGCMSACATAGHAIGAAMRYMQHGDADVMLVGGAEASLTPLTFAGFNNLRAMASGWNDDPQRASRPFDAKRSGFVMGEGAGIMVIETLEHAMKRGAKRIYGELAGYGATCDAHHITAPSPGGEGLARAISLAIAEANIKKELVGYINYEFPDPDCDLNYVPNKAVKRKLEAVISTTLGFGGHNAAILLRKLVHQT
eukprot:Selendium_serpulae@DN5224_c0_g1_i4.p1